MGDFQAEVFIGMQLHGMLIKHRKNDPPETANDLDPILTPIRDKAPATHAQCPGGETPTGADGIFRCI
ncbi:hypothetical protein D3C78_1976900 [compost metagenome]